MPSKGDDASNTLPSVGISGRRLFPSDGRVCEEYQQSVLDLSAGRGLVEEINGDNLLPDGNRNANGPRNVLKLLAPGGKIKSEPGPSGSTKSDLEV